MAKVALPGWHPASTSPFDDERVVGTTAAASPYCRQTLDQILRAFMEFELKFRIHPAVVIFVMKVALIIFGG